MKCKSVKMKMRRATLNAAVWEQYIHETCVIETVEDT